MAGISRTNLVRAPGHLKYGASTTIYSQTPVEVNLVTRHTDVKVEGIGRTRRTKVDQYLEITCTPPEFEGFGVLMDPYATMTPGTSVFGATDTALVFYGRDGKSRTFHCAAPTAFGISGKVGQPLFGQLTFTSILKNAAEPGDAGAYFTEASASYPGDAAYARSAVITPALKCAWGASPFDAFWVREGLDIAFGLELDPDTADGLGTLDMKFQDCIVNARGIPVGVTATQLYAAADVHQAMGAQRTENDLILSGTGFHFTAYSAQMEDPNTGFSATRLIPGQALWTTNRTITDGALNPAFRIGTAAPE